MLFRIVYFLFVRVPPLGIALVATGLASELGAPGWVAVVVFVTVFLAAAWIIGALRLRAEERSREYDPRVLEKW